MRVKKLSDVAKIIAGQSPPSSSYNENGEGLPFLQGKADFGEKYPTIRNWCTSPKKEAKKDDILISVRAPVGPVNILNINACIGRGLSAIRANKDTSSKYLYYYLKTNRRKIEKLSSGSTFKAITQKDLKTLKIPLPSLSDQQKIAQLLERVEQLIQERKASIVLLDELVKSTFLDMFGDVLNNSKSWPTVKFEKLIKLKRGYDFPKNERVHGKHPLFAASGKIDSVNEYKVKGPGIVTGRSGTIGVVKYVEDDYWPLNTTLYSQYYNGEPIYLKYLLEFFRLERYSKGAGVPTLNRNLVHSEQIIDVPIKEQSLFVDITLMVNKVRTGFDASLQELQQLFAALSQQAFKGELDVSKVKLSDKRKVYVKNLELSTGKPKDEKTNASTHKQPTKELKQDNELDSKWKYLRTLGGAVDGKIPFNAIEGKEVLETAFSKKEYGFRFDEFESFLEKERFSFTYEQTRDFIFQELEEGNLEQLYIADDFIDFGEEADPKKHNQGDRGKVYLKVVKF